MERIDIMKLASRLPACAIAIALTVGTAHAQHLFADDFNDAVADGWTPGNFGFTTGQYSAAGGVYRLSTAASVVAGTSFYGGLDASATSATFANGYFGADIVQENSATRCIVAVRALPDSTSYYGGWVSNSGGTLYLNRSDAGVITTLTALPFALTAGTAYTFEIGAIGSTIEFRAWLAGGSRPVAP